MITFALALISCGSSQKEVLIEFDAPIQWMMINNDEMLFYLKTTVQEKGSRSKDLQLLEKSSDFKKLSRELIEKIRSNSHTSTEISEFITNSNVDRLSIQ